MKRSRLVLCLVTLACVAWVPSAPATAHTPNQLQVTVMNPESPYFVPTFTTTIQTTESHLTLGFNRLPLTPIPPSGVGPICCTSKIDITDGRAHFTCVFPPDFFAFQCSETYLRPGTWTVTVTAVDAPQYAQMTMRYA